MSGSEAVAVRLRDQMDERGGQLSSRRGIAEQGLEVKLRPCGEGRGVHAPLEMSYLVNVAARSHDAWLHDAALPTLERDAVPKDMLLPFRHACRYTRPAKQVLHCSAVKMQSRHMRPASYTLPLELALTPATAFFDLSCALPSICAMFPALGLGPGGTE